MPPHQSIPSYGPVSEQDGKWRLPMSFRICRWRPLVYMATIIGMVYAGGGDWFSFRIGDRAKDLKPGPGDALQPFST
jgi:hypothetical protein